MENKDRKSTQPEFTPDYIDQLFSGTNSKPQPKKVPEVAPPAAEAQMPAPRKRKPSAAKQKQYRHKKLVTYIAAAAAVAAVCLMALLLRDPFADISEQQWETMCRDAYERLYMEDHLHFTQTIVRSTATATTTAGVEAWFSGENYYRVETDSDGQRTAFLAKDGAFYRNSHQEAAGFAWSSLSESPWSRQSTGAWDEADYVLDGIERKGKEMEVVFSKNAGSGKQLRVFYLSFRFDDALELKSILYSNVVYTGSEQDPAQIKSSVSDEYTFHTSTKEEIEASIEAPLQMIAEYNRESKKWSAIAAAVYEELCSETVLHYTYEENRRESDFVSTAREEGWICGTDSVTHTKTEGEVKTETGSETRRIEQIRLYKGSDRFSKVTKNGETDGWTQRSGEPYMYAYYGATWNKELYTFCEEVSSETGTDISFYRPSTLLGSDSLIPGITAVTFHLDKEINLYKITVSKIDGDLETEPYTVTQYHIHDVTEAQAREEIDKYYLMAISGN